MTLTSGCSKKQEVVQAESFAESRGEFRVAGTDRGISILGGMGYSTETDMQRYWRDARLLRIGPVSNEMARNMIAEGLGLPRSF